MPIEAEPKPVLIASLSVFKGKPTIGSRGAVQCYLIAVMTECTNLLLDVEQLRSVGCRILGAF